MLVVIAVGVVLATLEPARPDVPAGDLDIAADAIEGPAPERRQPPASGAARIADDAETRRATSCRSSRRSIFGVGLVAAGKAAALVPVAWVAVARAARRASSSSTLPLILQRRLG